MNSKPPISKEAIELNSRVLNIFMSEIVNFVKIFDFKDIPYINFSHFLSEILENESEIDDGVILSISNELFSYIQDHILSLGEDLDIKEFFNQRGIILDKYDVNPDFCWRGFTMSISFKYKNKLFTSRIWYSITDGISYNIRAINCFGVIVRSIVSTEIARIKKELELERASKEMVKIK